MSFFDFGESFNVEGGGQTYKAAERFPDPGGRDEDRSLSIHDPRAAILQSLASFLQIGREVASPHEFEGGYYQPLERVS